MKCLVTGGAGFIGSHLAFKLAKLGHEVVVFDNVLIEEAHKRLYEKDDATYPECSTLLIPRGISKINPWDEIRNSSAAVKAANPQRASTPICDMKIDIIDEFPFLQFDWCFHLAALADVVPSIERPLDYHVVNVDGTLHVLDYCIQTGVKKFVYASSTSIYGIPEEYPTPETAPASPQYPYALTKHLAEQYVMSWGRFYKLPAVSLRITTAYGPGMKSKGYGSAFKVFLAQKANNAPFTVVGDGQQSRDFIFVSDVVDAFIKAAESDVQGEIFNIGYGRPRKISELLELLGGGEIVYLPRRPGEPAMTWADITKAAVLLDWVPQVPLEEGVAALLDHLEDWKDEVVWTPETIKNATKSWFDCLS